jgi:hypothetical protein
MQRIFFAVAFAGALAASDFPSAEISNGLVTAKFYLPDAEKGYYRGTRFDWSGVIYSLRTEGHEFFGQWFPKYDPKLHDAIMGPVEEFRTNEAGLGYDEAQPGGNFIRIGVGVVRRPDASPYQLFKTYDIVDPGERNMRKGPDWIEFTHTLAGPYGYAYRYTKTVRLTKNKAEMTIEHSLRNTGKKPIQTAVYDHNFFVMDNQPTGPGASVKFPFELKVVRQFQTPLAEVRGKEILYLKTLETGQSVAGELAGYGTTASDYDIRMENKDAGAAVHITGDQPLAKVYYWSIRTTFCPEPYINLRVEPGRETHWKYAYQFYSLK